jgi:hypothetical protein
MYYNGEEIDWRDAPDPDPHFYHGWSGFHCEGCNTHTPWALLFSAPNGENYCGQECALDHIGKVCACCRDSWFALDEQGVCEECRNVCHGCDTQVTEYSLVNVRVYDVDQAYVFCVKCAEKAEERAGAFESAVAEFIQKGSKI